MDNWHVLLMDLGKLLLAALLGGVIGFERESHGQAAGFRTYLIVCIGACLMMLLSLHMEEFYHYLNINQSVVRLDPARIASYAIASMGFLGAGAIIKGRGTVRGLTTAAGLWAVTGIGLSIGAGYILQPIFTTFVILTFLYWIYPIRKLSGRRIYNILMVEHRGQEQPLEQIRKIISDFPSFSIQSVNYEHELCSQTTTYRVRIYSREEKYWEELVKKLSFINGILKIKWEEGDVP